MIVDPTVIQIGNVDIKENVRVGPYCVLGSPDITFDLNRSKLLTSIGSCTELGANVVVGCGTSVGSNCWIDHHCYLGCFSDVGSHVQVMYGARIYHRVVIADQTWVGGFICNDAQIGSNAVVMGRLVHSFVNAVENVPEKAPMVGERAFIGMGAVVIGGVHIGDGAYVAAGAVVTSNVPPHRLFAGVPATDHGKAPTPFKEWNGL